MEHEQEIAQLSNEIAALVRENNDLKGQIMVKDGERARAACADLLPQQARPEAGEHDAMTQAMKPRPELLALAEACGAKLTGKPDGSEPITVVFSIEAWRAFDVALQAGSPAP